jgi:3-hydroxybutyryl-CoA dehydrogenase
MNIAVIEGKTPARDWLSSRLPAGWQCIWVNEASELAAHGDADVFIDLAFMPDVLRIQQLSRLLPAPVMVHSVVHTLQEIGQPFIRLNAWPGMLERSVHEVVMSEPSNAVLEKFYGALQISYRIVPDVVGMISARILATIINEAYYTLQEDVSTRNEIDTAMKLGTNYPFGPFEWSERIGLENIYDLLNKLSKGDARYAPAAAMKEELFGL